MNDAACRVVYKVSQQGITFQSIGEIGYCDLGRGGAEQRECPPNQC